MTPIALFLYARPDHTRRTIEALLANRRTQETGIVVFCDGPRTPEAASRVVETREVAHALLDDQAAFAFVEFVEREENLGLARSIIGAIDGLLDRFDRLIVVEDDIVTSPSFLTYMLNALDRYAGTPEVLTVSAFSPPMLAGAIPPDYPFDAYFNPRFACWGWGIWADRWRRFDLSVSGYAAFKDDLDSQLAFNRGGDDLTQMLFHQMERGLNTWDIQVSFAHFALGGVSLCPCRSLTDNIGFDGSGEHCGTADHLRTDLSLVPAEHRFPPDVRIDERIMDSFRMQFRSAHPGLIGGGAQAYWAAQRTEADVRRLTTARNWIEAGGIENAWRLLELHLSFVPGDPEALVMMGRIALVCDQRDSAGALFRSALTGHGDHIEARLALAYLASGK